MDCLHYYCQGESHKADNKVCQDFAYTSSEGGVTIAIVCDGHGGNRYFRSDIGAKYAAEITAEAVKSFVKNTNRSLLENKPFTSVGPVSSQDEGYKETVVDDAFRQLFAYIISQWNIRISEHAVQNSVSEWEAEHVEQKYLDEFAAQHNLEKMYGCTLMAFVKAKRYWFAFHLGDGKCISLQPETIWAEPIPWDDRCFLNKTTSICDSDALYEFRYCYQGDGQFPTAIFLGSDGIDDSFGETTNMVNFYIQLAKEIAKSEFEAKESLESTLPELSKIGSKDDMSVACAYDRHELKKLVPTLLDWQIEQVQNAIDSINEKIVALTDKADRYADMTISDNKTKIELQYVRSDLMRAETQKETLIRKINKLLQEKEGDCFVPYSEETQDSPQEENASPIDTITESD